jgi:divalent metal cation (Fe/Co/Zn/Cd) transporter
LQTTHQNLRLQKIITAIAILLFVIKIIAWYLTNSVAILTDALESIVNVIAGLIGVYSLYVSAKPKDYDHPYGHGKAEFISAAVEGTLITVAGLIIIYEAVINLLNPHTIQKLDYGIMLVAITALINYGAGAVCIKTGTKNNSLALIASGKHLQLDKIVRSSIAGIMDEADEALLKKLVATLNAHRKENWIDLHNLRIIKYGATIHLDCHLTVPWYLNVHEAHKEIDALSNLAKNEYGESVELFVHSDGCLDFSCKICTRADCTVRKHTFEMKVEWTMENISSNRKHHV